MKKNELVSEIVNMNYGDCFNVNFDDRLYTYITKTRWIDNHCYIVGGAYDETIAKSILDDEEETVANNLIDEIFARWKFDNDINIVVSDNSKITVTRKGGDSFRSGTFENMIVIK